jgi:hypothetical protein
VEFCAAIKFTADGPFAASKKAVVAIKLQKLHREEIESKHKTGNLEF